MLTEEVHAGNGSAGQSSGGGRCLSVSFSVFSVPCGKPWFFSFVGPEPLPLFLFSFAYPYCFLSCCHLWWAWGTMLKEHRAFEGNVNCRQH